MFKKFKNKYIVFVILFAILVLGVFLYRSGRIKIFRRVTYFYAYFGSISTIKNGTAITISGIEVGGVSSVDVLSNNSIRIEFFIKNKYLDRVLDDSVLVPHRNVFLQTASIKLYPGNNKKKILDQNSTVFTSDSRYGAILKNQYEHKQNLNVDLDDMSKYFVLLLSSLDKETLKKYMQIFKQYLSYANVSMTEDSFNMLTDTNFIEIMDSNLMEMLRDLESMNIEFDDIVKFMSILMENKDNINSVIEHGASQITNVSFTVKQAQDMAPKIYDLINYINKNTANIVLFLEIYDKFQ